jgi:hypothetical protein
MDGDTNILDHLGSLTQRLEVVDVDDQRAIFLNGYLAARYACDDKATERVLITQLAEVLPLPDRQIAATFQIHPVTLSRFRHLARSGGAQALLPSKSGPNGPSKMNARLEGECRSLRAQGLSYRAIAKKVSTRRQVISHVSVSALFKTRTVQPQQGILLPTETASPTEVAALPEAIREASFVVDQSEMVPEAAPIAQPEIVPEVASIAQPEAELPCEAAPQPDTTQPPQQYAVLSAGEPLLLQRQELPGLDHGDSMADIGEETADNVRYSRYAGAMMLYATLGQIGLWDVFSALGAEVGPHRCFGWMQTVASVVFCFALRFHSIEDWKNGLRRDLGVLIGEAAAPSVLSLRTKVKALAESVDPADLSRAMFQRYLALEPVWEGLYYVDGHFCPYYGYHSTPKGWDAKRRLAAKGHTDVYLHDAKGRVLFFFSQPLNDSLARALPVAVAEIRKVHGHEPFTLVFDRGGYSGDAFRYLQAEKIGFITYLKGRKARRRYAPGRFHSGWFAFEGQRHTYRLMEKKTRMKKVGLIRTILFESDEGQQIPVLTNLATTTARPAKVVHCLRLRWRQENSFKFLSENYDIDQIIQYGATPEAQDRLIPNPKRKALQERERVLNKEIQALEAQLGRTLNDNQESRRQTSRGLKIATAGLRRQIAQKRQTLSRLENRLRHTPGKISALKIDKQRELLREDRRLLVNALKLATANAEHMLALRFDQIYQCPKDAFSIFRALLHLPGLVKPTGPDHIDVLLQRPDSEKVAQALENLLPRLNTQQPRMLGDGPILSFRLTDVNTLPPPSGFLL